MHENLKTIPTVHFWKGKKIPVRVTHSIGHFAYFVSLNVSHSTQYISNL